jgi:HEPN domain-containing protein
MSSTPLTQAQILVIKAAEDETVLHQEGVSDSILGVHAQQVVEKLIKALLSQLSVEFELTHNLERLEILVKASHEALPPTPIALAELTDFAVVYRYDLLYQVRPPDRADLIETVRLIREHVTARIAALAATL